MHGSHCYTATGTLACGWPERHAGETRMVESTAQRAARNLGTGWRDTRETDWRDDPADRPETRGALLALGIIR